MLSKTRRAYVIPRPHFSLVFGLSDYGYIDGAVKSSRAFGLAYGFAGRAVERLRRNHGGLHQAGECLLCNKSEPERLSRRAARVLVAFCALFVRVA